MKEVEGKDEPVILFFELAGSPISFFSRGRGWELGSY